MRIIPRVCSFLLPGFNQKRLQKNKTSRTITLRNRQKPLCLHIAECFGHWRNQKTLQSCGNDQWMFQSRRIRHHGIIISHNEANVKKTHKKYASWRTITIPKLELWQQVQERAIYMWIYSYYIHNIYIYYVYINTNRHSWKQNAPFWLEKKNSFARQNNKQKVSGVYVFIHIYIYLYTYQIIWMNESNFPCFIPSVQICPTFDPK